MPHTRHPLAYPIGRLFLHVGMALQTWIPRLPPAETDEDRERTAQEVAEKLSLPRAVELGLLRRYVFYWTSGGHIRTIDLQAGPKHSRSPGLKELRRLFFK